MEWTYKELKQWIKNGCNIELGNQVINLNIALNNLKRLPIEIFQLNNLQKFKCGNNRISELPKEIGNLVNLKEFDCRENKISKLPEEIGKLVNLEQIICSFNILKELPISIGNLVNLKHLYCNHNQIIELPVEIGKLVNLEQFNCSHNQISKLPEEIGGLVNLEVLICSTNKISELPISIEYLVNLQELICYKNDLKDLPKIGKLVNLQELFCQKNQISELQKEIGRLINLQQFDCSDNKIKTIPIEITNCINLHYFQYSNNEIEYIPPSVQRWLNSRKYAQEIYNDNQSVHNHNIQEGIRNSINYLMRSKPTLTFEALKDHILNNDLLEVEVKNILFEYCSDKTIHSVLNITFEELLLSVYDFILKHESINDIFKVLNIEMKDSLCKCFTGRISRLVNVLNGIDENIKINISQAEQIGNIFILVRDKLEKEGRYTDELFKEIVMKELVEERGYDETVIKDWISFSG